MACLVCLMCPKPNFCLAQPKINIINNAQLLIASIHIHVQLAFTLVGKMNDLIFVLEFNVTPFSYRLGAVLPEERTGPLG